MLMDARSVSHTAPELGGTSSVHLLALLKQIGIADAVAKKAVHRKGGIDVVARVASGEAEIGITLISEIVPVKGARFARPVAGGVSALDRLHLGDPGEQQAAEGCARLCRCADLAGAGAAVACGRL